MPGRCGLDFSDWARFHTLCYDEASTIVVASWAWNALVFFLDVFCDLSPDFHWCLLLHVSEDMDLVAAWSFWWDFTLLFWVGTGQVACLIAENRTKFFACFRRGVWNHDCCVSEVHFRVNFLVFKALTYCCLKIWNCLLHSWKIDAIHFITKSRSLFLFIKQTLPK